MQVIDKKTKLIAKIINVATPILLAFIIAAIPIIFVKENPIQTYFILFSKTIFDGRSLLVILHYGGPLLLAGLAIAISFKAGLFNMGIESSILTSGFVVAILGYRLGDLPSAVLIPLLLLVGIVVGVLTGLIPALLKAYFNINEMVVTLLLNYAIIIALEYLATYVFRDTSSGYVATHMIGINAIFKGIFDSPLTLFFLVALTVFVIVWFILKHTKLGIEIEAIGKNVNFSEALGMSVRKKVIIIMLTSGAVAGLAGAGWMMSEKYIYTTSFSGNPGLGWDGMVISLLGNHNPIGIVFSTFFYSLLKVGGNEIGIYTNVPSDIINLIQALLILFLSFKMIGDKKSITYISLRNFLLRVDETKVDKKASKEVK